MSSKLLSHISYLDIFATTSSNKCFMFNIQWYFLQHCDGLLSTVCRKLPLVVAIVCCLRRVCSLRPGLFCILFLHKAGHWRIRTYHGLLLLYLDNGNYFLAANRNDWILRRFLFYKKDLCFCENWLNEDDTRIKVTVVDAIRTASSIARNWAL